MKNIHSFILALSSDCWNNIDGLIDLYRSSDSCITTALFNIVKATH